MSVYPASILSPEPSKPPYKVFAAVSKQRLPYLTNAPKALLKQIVNGFQLGIVFVFTPDAFPVRSGTHSKSALDH